MVSVVNGYVCKTSCDVDAAKRGLDPENPTKDPVKQKQIDERHGKIDAGIKIDAGTKIGTRLKTDAARSASSDPAVTFGGALAQTAAAAPSARTKSTGTILDITA